MNTPLESFKESVLITGAMILVGATKVAALMLGALLTLIAILGGTIILLILVIQDLINMIKGR